MFRFLSTAFFLLSFFWISLFPGVANAEFKVSAPILKLVNKEFGAKAKKRLLAWQNLINKNQNKTEQQKLHITNNFLNQLGYYSDMALTGQAEYWMTPIEFLSMGGGDCEDFSIAKYFTLRKLGIPDSKLRLTYVKATTVNTAHMVLAYYPTPGADPLILDNLISSIRKASQRQDLIPVYSFNGEGLWLAKKRKFGGRAGSSQRLSRWRKVLEKMRKVENTTDRLVT